MRRERFQARMAALSATAAISGLLAATGAAAQPAPVTTTTPVPDSVPQVPAAAPASVTPGSGAVSASDIVVTGTRIRGVAPVGSTTIQLDQKDLARTGQTSTADILNNIPSVLSLGTGNSYTGGSPQSTNNLNALAFNKSPNLRGFGPQATLSLVNGRRVPYEGGNMNAFDGDNIPSQMLQRVEVVADGTSPIYGADAIAGTVNYVLRDPFTGLEAYGQYGNAKGQDSWQGTVVGGYDWHSGGIVLSYQHTSFDRLRASSRPSLYNDDYTLFGGPPSTNQSVPGNIIANGVTYAIPAGQDGSMLTLAQLGAAGTANRQNAFEGYDAVPQSKRNQVAGNFRQKITDWLDIFADGFYSKRDYDIALVSQNTRVTLSIPNSNFYSPCNHSLAGAPAALLAACATGALTVGYNTLFDSGPAERSGFSRTWNVSGGARVSFLDDFKATVTASTGNHREESASTIYFGNGLPLLTGELAGTTATTAFNPFCDGRQYSCNSSSLTSGIAGAPFLITGVYKDEDYQLNVDGSLFELPGGKVRIAAGAEHYRGRFINTDSFSSVPSGRHINSAYAELYVPIFGDGNAIPFIHKLELDIAGRIDKYSDVGTTKNPKIGLNWSPIEDIKLHASYGRSFRAPGLADNNPFVQAGYLTPGPYPGNSVSASICPTCAAVPGGLTFVQAIGGANGNLVPEKSRSYSIGGDFAPRSIPGLTASINYWNVRYTGQVNTPVYNVGPFQAVNQQLFNQYIIYNPALFPTLAASNPVAFFGNFPQVNTSNADCGAVYGKNVTTQAMFNSMIACINGGGAGGLFGAPASAASTAAVESAHRLNSGSTAADGFDLSARYTWNDGLGSWRLGVIGEYVHKWDVSAIPGAPVVNQVNRFGYPQRFKARGEAGWSDDIGPGRLNTSVFVNYSNKYRIDANLLPAGVSSSYSRIDSYTTVDLTVSYDTGDRPGWGALHGITFTVSAQNVFDKLPPLVLNSGSDGGIMFDPSNGSPLGRVVQLQIGKKF